jgi:hypothetical protein
MMATSAAGTGAAEGAAAAGPVVIPPASPAHSEATRYLCAAAHLDRGLRGRPGTQLRQQVLDSLMVDRIHALGTSPGVDLRQVVLEVDRAAQRKLIRDLALSALLLLAVVVTAVSRSPLVFVLFFALACEVVHVEAWISTYSVVARRMLRGRFEPDPGTGHRSRDVLDAIDAAQSGNVTVYSGFTPFVGVGYPHGGWSFSVNISEGTQDMGVARTPQPFALTDLYACVAADVEALGIPNVTLEDRLYADGRRLREDGALLADPLRRPVTSVSAVEMAAAVGEAGERLRYYKVVHIIGWGGELVLSIFVRFVKVERSLFAEASYFLLPPLSEACHAVDRIHPLPSWRDNLRLLWESILATPLLWARSPRQVARALTAPLRHAWRLRRLRRQAAANPEFDYGATTSVRDEQKNTNYRQYFQQLDRDLYVKVVERQLLDSLLRFLDAHDVDTSEMRQRGSTILNNGVMMSGGVLQADTVAVGARAQAKGGPQAPVKQGTGSP